MKYLILILSFITLSCGASKNKVAVYMSPTCGCCKKWVSHLENNGFEVESIYEDNMRSIKTQYKISQKNTSCHTGIIGSYFIEGHVPASDIKELLEKTHGISFTIFIAIFSDSNNSKQKIIAYYRDIYFSSE